MTPELLPCPFCGGRPNIDRWVNLTENGVIYCAACDFTLPPTVWNRRTPDLTDALAERLCLRPADALAIIDRLPQPCGGETCRDEECAKRADLHAKIGAAADLYRALVASYESKEQDLARETRRNMGLTDALARLKALEGGGC